MKKPNIFQVSNSLFGVILMLSLTGAVLISSLGAFAELFAVCKSQWQGFTDGLSMMQPHQTVFPN